MKLMNSIALVGVLAITSSAAFALPSAQKAYKAALAQAGAAVF